MGMYTEIYVNVDLHTQTPSEVIATLRAMCDKSDGPELAGKPKRWSYMFNNGSDYTPLTECGNLSFNDIRGAWSLIAKGDIKNYEGEIEQFFEWIMPWVDAELGDFIGYMRYEEQQMPTLIQKK